MTELQKYLIELIYQNIEGSKKYHKDTNRYQFKCPICGDSKKSATKMRGWLYLSGDKKHKEMFYRCYNQCGTMSAEKFLKQAFDIDETELTKIKFQSKLYSTTNTDEATKIEQKLIEEFGGLRQVEPNLSLGTSNLT